jgi:hypothetical protein
MEHLFVQTYINWIFLVDITNISLKVLGKEVGEYGDTKCSTHV